MVQMKCVQILTAVVMLTAFQLAYCADKWCPDGMILNDDKCFEAYLEREAPYLVAKEICKENGGQVALGYNFEITNTLARIGLKHRFENYWVQSDEKMNSDECQASMYRNDFEISTKHCNNAMFYICQFDFEVSNSSKYENGYFQFSEDRKTFSGAQKSCSNLGGKIATVDNKDVLNFLKEVINKDLTWQRFSDWQLENFQFSYYPNFWAGSSFNIEIGKWVCDFGTPVDSFQHLSGKGNSENCLKFNQNSLEITDCDEYNYFFCQFPAESKLVPIPSLDDSNIEWKSFLYMIIVTLAIPVCLKIHKSLSNSAQEYKQVHISNRASKKFPSSRSNLMKILFCVFVFRTVVAASQSTESDSCLAGQFRFNGESCYEPRMKRAATFENANEICLDSGGKLAVIRDYITQEFLNRVALKTMYENFWVGNANISSIKDCIAIKSRDDYTQEKEHPDQNFFYVCELDECSSSSLTIGKFNNKCYEMTMERSKCLVAKKSCEKKGGRLAVIDTKEKLNFIQSLIYMNEWWTIVPNSVIDQLYLSDTPIFWSGMKFEQRSKKWTSVGGTQGDLFYNYMFSDSDLKHDSDPSSNSDFCVTSEFKLSDCDSYKYFFCEYSHNFQTHIVPMTFINILDQSRIGFVGTCTLFAIVMISAVIATFAFFRKRLQNNVVPVAAQKASEIQHKSYYQTDDGHQPLVHNMKL